MIQACTNPTSSDRFSTHYVACWVQDNCHVRCWHRHTTILEAIGCIENARGFVRAVTDGRDRLLTKEEYDLFVRLLLEMYWAERRISREDFLTRVLNRRGFMEIVEYERKRSHRFGRPMTAVSIDLDGFGLVNKRIGYKTGDLVLINVAETITNTLRKMDSVARFGGDEFAMLLPETNAHSSRVVIEKCQKALIERMTHYNWGVTFSIGVVTFKTMQTAEKMIELANRVMSNAKRSGKDRISYLTVD